MKKECVVGKTFHTNSFGKLTVVEKVGKSKALVRFEETGFETVAYLSEVRRGKVADKLKPTYLGVGILGSKSTKNLENNKHCKEYILWSGMLCRCYDEKYSNNKPTYKGCTTSDMFRNYSFFYEWCDSQIGFSKVDESGKSFQLDKDILVKGNKLYSEDTCCFVPQEVNLLLATSKLKRGEYPLGVSYHKRVKKYSSTVRKGGGNKHLGYFLSPEEAFLAYKAAKEDYIKEVANKWKDQIDPRVYEALMKWEISESDQMFVSLDYMKEKYYS